MGKKRMVAVMALAAAFAAVKIWTLPSRQQTHWSVTVAAPARVVLAVISDLHRWSRWCRPDQLASALRRTHGGPPTGVGSTCYWSGQESAGRMTVLAASAAKVEIELELKAPHPAESDLELTLAARDGGTRVALALVGGARGVGPDLEAGLAGIREAAEQDAKIESSRVERSAIIAAPAAAVLAHLAEVRRWPAWSPWADADPTARRSYGGPASGRGASCYWNGEHGSGRITIISAGPEGVTAELETLKPQTTLSDLEFGLAGEGGATKVTAAATGTVSAADLERALARLGDAIGAEAMRAAK